MFAIAFDLVMTETENRHPTGVSQACADIETRLLGHGFVWRQGSGDTCDSEDLAKLFATIYALKARPWFPASVRDIRPFRVEHWSDFTSLIKS